MNKRQILFHLGRRYRELTDTKPDHVAMAKQGASYTARQAKEKEAEKYNAECEALGQAILFIERNMPDDVSDKHECG